MLVTLAALTFPLPLAWGMPNGFELLLVAGLGLLLFGKRLPEVGKSLGQGIVQFKKGLKGIEDDVATADRDLDSRPKDQGVTQPKLSQQTTVQQYDPYTGKPITVPDQHA